MEEERTNALEVATKAHEEGKKEASYEKQVNRNPYKECGITPNIPNSCLPCRWQPTK